MNDSVHSACRAGLDKAFEQALEVCVKAMNDAEAPAAVRAALIKAAEEAEIGVRE